MKIPLFELAIPNPCHKTWDAMDRSPGQRFCDSCQTPVIDFESLTPAEAAQLMTTKKGRLCARIIHDPSGNIVFRRPDPSKGNLARIAGLSLISISSVAAAAAAPASCTLQVSAKDATGAPIQSATVTTKGAKGKTGPDGNFTATVPSGRYRIDIQKYGFKTFHSPAVKVACKQSNPTLVDAKLEVATMGKVITIKKNP
jgi:hypothetical protein